MKDYKRLSKIEFNKEAKKFDTAKKTDMYSLCKKGYSYLIDELEQEDFQSLLDVGCGTGNSIFLISNKYPNRNYTGIDLADEMIKIAKKKNIKNAIFLEGDSENMPFEDNMFDVIICKESFHHYPHVENFFNESYRVLKKNGRIIIMDMYPPSIFAWIYNHILFPIFCNTGDFRIYSPREVEKLFLKSRFSVENSKKIDSYRYICSARKN